MEWAAIAILPNRLEFIMAKQLYSIRVEKHTDTRFPCYSVFISKIKPTPYSMPFSWNIDGVLDLSMIVRLPLVMSLPGISGSVGSSTPHVPLNIPSLPTL